MMSDGTKLREAKLRGLQSYGMMMSERELGISADHGGILLLDDSYEVGRPVADYFPVGETVLDIDVTPNRPDLVGHDRGGQGAGRHPWDGIQGP